MKRLLLMLLLIGCLVLTACGYPVSHHTEASAVPGAGILHIDYELRDEGEKEAFNKAVSYKLYDDGAKLYVYRLGTYNANEALGQGSVAELEAKDALSFQYTGESSYRLSIRYSGLKDGVYEIHWEDTSSSAPSKFYFQALDAAGNVLTWTPDDPSSFPGPMTDFYSYDSYVDEDDGTRQAIVFVVGNGTDVPPKTGDSATPLLWACLLLVGAAGMMIAGRRKAHG